MSLRRSVVGRHKQAAIGREGGAVGVDAGECGGDAVVRRDDLDEVRVGVAEDDLRTMDRR